MPLRDTKHAPELFKGQFWKVTRFIEVYSQLLEFYQVTSERDKCRGIIEYCSQTVEDFITMCPNYITPNWNALKKDILKYYDAERMETRIQPSDFIEFLQRQIRKPITTLSQWKKYNRKYLSYAGFLMRNHQLDQTEYHGYFWYGIPEDLRSIFEVRLQAKNPTFDNSSEPWPIPQIQEVAEAYLQRSKFQDKLFHLPALGLGRRFEEEDDDDDEYDEDDDDSDYEEDRRLRRKKKSSKKKPKFSSRSLPKLPPTQLLKEEPSRKILPPPEEDGLENIIRQLNTMTLEDPRYRTLYNRVVQNEPAGLMAQHLMSRKIAPPPPASDNVGSMIHRLNTMSRDDPEYGSLYWKAVTADQTGLAAQCITWKPRQESRMARDPPPHQSQPALPPGRPMYPRGILPMQGMQGSFVPRPNPTCYGCFDQGHVLRNCPKISNMLLNKVIVLDDNFKYRFPDGQLIPRRHDESIVQCMERLRPQQNQVQFATIGEAIERYYNHASKRKYQQYIDEVDEDEESDSANEGDDDEFNDTHWTWRSQRRQEYPTYAAYEAIDEEDDQQPYEAYPVERGDKFTRQARTTAMDGPARKTRFEGVVLPARPPRAPVKVPDPAPFSRKSSFHPLTRPPEPLRPRENIPTIPAIPIPVDARKPRFKDNADIIMKELAPEPREEKENEPKRKPVTLQDYSKPVEGKLNDPPIDRPRAGPRQSELSARIDTKAVVEHLLKTPVSLSLEEVLGASREISNSLQDTIKLKNPPTKPLATNAVHEVFNNSIPKEETNDAEEYYEPDYNEEDTVEEKTLIKLVLTCNGRPITAVIDTGSQLNIISQAIAQKFQLAIDISKRIVMSDVNGNSGMLEGLIQKVPLRCGALLTEANLHVGRDHLPFDLLLGRPWQRGNRVSIDEREKGTYLVFKEPDSDKPKFEIFINPAQFISRTFKSFKKPNVYSIIEGPENNSTRKIDVDTKEKPPTQVLDTSENISLIEIPAELPTRPTRAKDPKRAEEIDKGITPGLVDGLKRLYLEYLPNRHVDPPSQAPEAILKDLAEKCALEKELMELGGKRLREINKRIDEGLEICDTKPSPKKKSDSDRIYQDINIGCMMKRCGNMKEEEGEKEERWNCCSRKDKGFGNIKLKPKVEPLDNKEDIYQVKQWVDEREEGRDQCNCSPPEKEVVPITSQKGNFRCIERRPQRFRHGKDLPDCYPEYQMDQIVVSEGLRIRKARDKEQMDMSSYKLPESDRSMFKGYIYTVRGRKNDLRILSPVMNNPPRAYEPPTDDPIHPVFNIPMHQIFSTIAKTHGQGVFMRTDRSHKPPFTLSLQAEHVLLATNTRVQEDSVIPFCCAELTSNHVTLEFLVNGTPHKVTGDAYIQFNYFMADQNGRDFINAYRAHPPYPPVNADAASDAVDAFDASVIATENSAPSIVLDITPLGDPDHSEIRPISTFNSGSTSILSPTTSLGEDTVDERCPPDGQGAGSTHVLFAAVADPLFPPHPPHVHLPSSRPHHVVPSPTSDNEDQVLDDSRPRKRNTEDLVALEILQRPSTALGWSMDPVVDLCTEAYRSVDPGGSGLPSQARTTPTHVFAYGPFPNPQADPLHPFEYRVYLHPVPNSLYSTTFKFAYGNSPHTPIEQLDLEDEIDEDFISSLDDDRIRFLVLAHYLFKNNAPDNFLIYPPLLTHGWIPPSARRGGTIFFRYPLIEILLTLSTYVIRSPHGRLATLLRRYKGMHPQMAAHSIFRVPTPLGPPESPDQSSSESSVCYSLPDSYEWEEVSTSTKETGEDDTQSPENPALPVSEPREPRPLTPFGFHSTNFTLRTLHSAQNSLPSIHEILPVQAPAATLLLSKPPSEATVNPSETQQTTSSYPPPVITLDTDSSPTLTYATTTPTDDDVVSPSYSPVDHAMSDITSDDDEDPPQEPMVESWEPQTTTGWDTPDRGAWGEPQTPQRYIGLRSHKQAEEEAYQVRKALAKVLQGTDTYQGPNAVGTGILAYGPFSSTSDPSSPPSTSLKDRDYRLFIHTTTECDALDLFAYGGPGFRNGEIVTLYKMPVSPFILDARRSYVREYGDFIHHTEAYICGDKRFVTGVPIPEEYTKGAYLLPSPHDGIPQYRLPLVENFLATIAARCGHPRLAHPFGRLELTHIRHLVSPRFPIRDGADPSTLFPPDLPYIRAKFHPDDERHPNDTKTVFRLPYYGCLPRKPAYLFQQLFPIFAPHLYHTACATYSLLYMHANPKTQPTIDTTAKIEWDELLDPQSFRDVFLGDSPKRILERVSPKSGFPNQWTHRLPYLLQCTRQVTLLIKSFEAFFKALGFEGLREIVNTIGLNTGLDFFHNLFLNTDETIYLVALYDFCLREHSVNLAQAILRILHIQFEDPYHLSKCREVIVDRIDLPTYSYVVEDEDENMW